MNTSSHVKPEMAFCGGIAAVLGLAAIGFIVTPLLGVALLVLGSWVGLSFVGSRGQSAREAREPSGAHVEIMSGVAAPTSGSRDWAFDRLYHALKDAPHGQFVDVTVRASDLAQILERVDRSGLRK